MWQKRNSKIVFRHPRLVLAEDTVLLPDGTQTEYLKFVEKNDSVAVICTKSGKILLQKEYSYPPNETLFQLPGGRVENNETPEKAALRELTEEAGLSAKRIENIGWFYADNRRSNARMHVFVATDLTKVEKRGGDKEEDITSHWTSLSEVSRLIQQGEIVNYSLLAAWSLYNVTDAQ